jgi:hypothetical protein
MKRVHVLFAAVAAAVFTTSAMAADKPNILFIVSDDTGYGDPTWTPDTDPELRGVTYPDGVVDLDRMATCASAAGVKLLTKDREGQPIIFDSYEITPVPLGTEGLIQ